MGTALQCPLPSSTMGGGRHSVRRRKDKMVSTSHFTSPAAADTASTWPGQVALSPMTSTGTGQQVCDNGAVTRRAEKDSAVGSEMLVRTEQAVPLGSVPFATEQVGPSGAVQGNAIRISGMGTAQGSATRVSAIGTAPLGQSRALPSGFIPWGRSRQCHCHEQHSRTHRRGFYPPSPPCGNPRVGSCR